MSLDIIEEARIKIYNSNVMKYVSKEKIDNALKKIHVYTDYEQFINEYGKNNWNNGKLMAFHRKNETYLGPDATAHSVIHELLHEISSEFDKEGVKTKTGIRINSTEYFFSNEVNEGCTDYLAMMISGEKESPNPQGTRIFSKLGHIITKYTGDEDSILQMYLSNDTKFLCDFFDYFGKENNTSKNFYDNFLYMDNQKVDILMGTIDKNVDKFLNRQHRKQRIDNVINKIKNIFLRKNQKLLTDGKTEHYKNNYYKQKNSHEEFVNQYNFKQFQSMMTQDEIQNYNKNTQQNLQENQPKYENESERY